MAKAAAVPTWHKLAQPTALRRAAWARGDDRTRWATCGWSWDAVAITPMSLGLDALVAMRAGARSGYPVLGDRLRDAVYVMVASGTGEALAEVPGTRVLGRGRLLLMPCTEHGTPSAHWISAPKEEPALLVRADRLTTHLRELTTPITHERAAS